MMVLRSLWILTVLLVAGTAAAQDKPPSGERRFFADISAENQTVYTESEAVGRADFTLDLSDLKLSWTLTYRGLTSPLKAVHIHGPAQPGTNAPPMIDLGAKGLASPLTGTQTVTEAQVQYMLQGWTYVSLHTARYPRGEIRGKIQVRRPQP